MVRKFNQTIFCTGPCRFREIKDELCFTSKGGPICLRWLPYHLQRQKNYDLRTCDERTMNVSTQPSRAQWSMGLKCLWWRLMGYLLTCWVLACSPVPKEENNEYPLSELGQKYLRLWDCFFLFTSWNICMDTKRDTLRMRSQDKHKIHLFLLHLLHTIWYNILSNLMHEVEICE